MLIYTIQQFNVYFSLQCILIKMYVFISISKFNHFKYCEKVVLFTNLICFRGHNVSKIFYLWYHYFKTRIFVVYFRCLQECIPKHLFWNSMLETLNKLLTLHALKKIYLNILFKPQKHVAIQKTKLLHFIR